MPAPGSACWQQSTELVSPCAQLASFPSSICPSTDGPRPHSDPLAPTERLQVPVSTAHGGCSRHQACSAHVPSSSPLQGPPAQALLDNTYASFSKSFCWPSESMLGNHPLHLGPHAPLSSTNDQWNLVDRNLCSFSTRVGDPKACPPLSQFPSRMKLQVRQQELDCLPSLPASLSHPPPLFLRVAFHVNCLHLDPGLRICFLGNPAQDRHTEMKELTEGPSSLGFMLGGLYRNQCGDPAGGTLTQPGSGQRCLPGRGKARAESQRTGENYAH